MSLWTEAVARRWRASKARNSSAVEKDLDKLEKAGFGYVEEARDALDNYRAIERSDYEDQEEYSDARTEAWGEVLDALDSIEME